MATALELQHFALLRLTYTPHPTNFAIVAYTNNPCHLTCYYTAIEPVRHKTSRIVRGINSPWGAYWCFVAWKSVEQEEAGDTFTHTFIMPSWTYCQTKWFTFRGTVAGILSPSNTPILKYHNSFATRYEHCIAGWFRHDWLTTRWFCQTYTPLASHTITKVRLYLSRNFSYTGYTFTISIRNTGATGKPILPDLSVATIVSDTIPVWPARAWIDLYPSPNINQIAGTKYAIVARSGGDLYRYAIWGSNQTNPYPRGSGGRSTNAGATWHMYDGPPNNFDSLFEEWGIPLEV